MSEREEFRGDECVVLPGNYLNSVEAVADIYSDELAAVANNFKVDQLSRRRKFLRSALLVPVIWALSAIWTVCA
jgi:hypothetical protein